MKDHLFLNSVIPSWNDLPQNVKEANTLKDFKGGVGQGEYGIYYDASDLEARNCIYQYRPDTALCLRIHSLIY